MLSIFIKAIFFPRSIFFSEKLYQTLSNRMIPASRKKLNLLRRNFTSLPLIHFRQKSFEDKIVHLITICALCHNQFRSLLVYRWINAVSVVSQKSAAQVDVSCASDLSEILTIPLQVNYPLVDYEIRQHNGNALCLPCGDNPSSVTILFGYIDFCNQYLLDSSTERHRVQ